MRKLLAICPMLLLMFAGIADGVELTTLSAENWKQFVVRGKEADAIYGDYVLRNDRISAVIAAPVHGRNANMTVRNVGWAIIDLTQRSRPNDQLSAFYPGSLRHSFTSGKVTAQVDNGQPEPFQKPASAINGSSVSITCSADPMTGRPDVSVRYTLKDGDSFVLVETIYENSTDNQYTEEWSDTIRADGTFEFSADGPAGVFWANDDWFRQTYAVVCDGYELSHEGNRGVVIQYKQGGVSQVRAGRGTTNFARKILPAANHVQSVGLVHSLKDPNLKTATLLVRDPRGPIARARVTVSQSSTSIGTGRTDKEGRLEFPIAAGEYEVLVQAQGHPDKTVQLSLPASSEQSIDVEPCGLVVAQITDAEGEPIPCKVSFHGIAGTPDPYFGPTTAVTVQNVRYSANGRFRQDLAPGRYRAIVSYGPEHDALFSEIEVKAGQETPLRGTLIRTVDTTGWISSDFHSHSSPSGDNTCSQRARVLNLLCEHVEFAPCTEHNRIDTYVPHLKKLKVAHRMATCSGMELTGQPLPLNHQNAFPLKMHPRTQDNGAPKTDENPIVQIERLAMWDNSSDKLVQINHPNLVQMIGDRDEDGMADGGFAKMFDYMDVVELHPLQPILLHPGTAEFNDAQRNRIFHWMQMLNLGYRVSGVVNTDAHYSFHESGGLRNFIRCDTDDPAKIDTLHIVHRATKGNLVMTTGPFMVVEAKSGEQSAGPGDDLSSSDGNVQLSVRVQCPNWFDINRVQVFVNGRFDEKANFTRQSNPTMFRDEVLKFDATIPMQLTTDAHLIVCATGEGITLGDVVGPNWGKQPPIAVANPIYVDVDGNGFHANGDLLDAPLPIERTQLPQR